MPAIAWALFVFVALSGGLSLAGIMKGATTDREATPGVVVASTVIVIGLYSWLLWAVVRLATT